MSEIEIQLAKDIYTKLIIEEHENFNKRQREYLEKTDDIPERYYRWEQDIMDSIAWYAQKAAKRFYVQMNE